MLPEDCVRKHGLGGVAEGAGGYGNFATREGGIEERANIVLIDVERELRSLSHYGQGVSNVESGIDGAVEVLANQGLSVTVGVVYNQAKVISAVLADAEEVEFILAGIGAKGQATAITAKDAHLYLESKVAEDQVLVFGKTGCIPVAGCLQHVIGSIDERAAIGRRPEVVPAVSFAIIAERIVDGNCAGMW